MATFSLTPAEWNIISFLDLLNKENQFIYATLTSSFWNKYDRSTRGILALVTQLKSRANTAGWENTTTNIMVFDRVKDGVTTSLNILENFGFVTLEEVQQHAKTYCKLQTRAAQNAY